MLIVDFNGCHCSVCKVIHLWADPLTGGLACVDCTPQNSRLFDTITQLNRVDFRHL